MTLQKMTLPSIIQHATPRHLREIAEGCSYELICNAYYRNVEQYVTFPLSLVMVINLFTHNKTNVSTVEFGMWSVIDRVKCILKCTIFALLVWPAVVQLVVFFNSGSQWV